MTLSVKGHRSKGCFIPESITWAYKKKSLFDHPDPFNCHEAEQEERERECFSFAKSGPGALEHFDDLNIEYRGE